MLLAVSAMTRITVSWIQYLRLIIWRRWRRRWSASWTFLAIRRSRSCLSISASAAQMQSVAWAAWAERCAVRVAKKLQPSCSVWRAVKESHHLHASIELNLTRREASSKMREWEMEIRSRIIGRVRCLRSFHSCHKRTWISLGNLQSKSKKCPIKSSKFPLKGRPWLLHLKSSHRRSRLASTKN